MPTDPQYPPPASELPTIGVQLNHTAVYASDRHLSAEFLAAVRCLRMGAPFGPFLPVGLDDPDRHNMEVMTRPCARPQGPSSSAKTVPCARRWRGQAPKGAAVAAAGSVVGSGLGPGFLTAVAQASPRAPISGATGSIPFLEGAFAPVTEGLTTFDLNVIGRIPQDLDGRYLRNGPNALGVEDVRAHHWMIGDGMVHGVRLRAGRAEWYRNR